MCVLLSAVIRSCASGSYVRTAIGFLDSPFGSEPQIRRREGAWSKGEEKKEGEGECERYQKEEWRRKGERRLGGQRDLGDSQRPATSRRVELASWY